MKGLKTLLHSVSFQSIFRDVWNIFSVLYKFQVFGTVECVSNIHSKADFINPQRWIRNLTFVDFK